MRDTLKDIRAECCPVCESYNGEIPNQCIDGPFKGLYQMRCTKCGFSGPARKTAWASILWWNYSEIRRAEINEYTIPSDFSSYGLHKVRRPMGKAYIRSKAQAIFRPETEKDSRMGPTRRVDA